MNTPVLSVRNISKSFGAVIASSDISLELRNGEIHALIGPNGAGKSTLIKQIAGGLKPDSGSIHLLGQDVTGRGTMERARMGLARTFQISSLAMEDTVLQNTLLGAIGASGKRLGFFRSALAMPAEQLAARAALARVGLQDHALTPAAELSHGQRRQLEVAVALTLKPKAFVLDEPMAGLGADGSRRLTDLLSGLRKEAPILLVEHDMDAVFTLADRISVLDAGKIIATGTRDEIRSDPVVRSAYLGDMA